MGEWRLERGYRVQLDVFEGPLDLLCHLVEEEKIDIWEIPIARITEQYLAYLDAMRVLDIEVAAEFVVMAARLLYIKAQMLLPKPPGEEGADEAEDPRLDLALLLMEYKLFREASRDLAERAESRWALFGRPEVYAPKRSDVRYTDPVGNVTLKDLSKAFLRILSAYHPPKAIPIPSVKVSVSERVRTLRALFAVRRRVPFHALFEEAPSRPEVIATFLALLELVRQGVVRAEQPSPFGPIVIEAREDAKEGAVSAV